MTSVLDQIQAVFADAGVSGWLHARHAQGPERDEVSYGADRPVATASVYKLPLMVAMMRMADRGELDLRERVVLPAADRTVGPTGISILLDDVTMSWRDLAASMMAVSDNAAADTILRRIGQATVDATLAELGLRNTRILGGTRDAHQLLHDDTGAANLAAALESLDDEDRHIESRIYDPLHASHATARDMTALLYLVWSDRAASPTGCAFIRAAMARQAWGTRLASGFAFSGVTVAGKTGTMGALRHEVGVVRYDGETPYAVAVFTQSARSVAAQPRVDAVIGEAARLAIDHLRMGAQ